MINNDFKFIPTKTITLPNLHFKEQSDFLSFIYKNIHLFSVKKHKKLFVDMELNTDLIHNKHSINQPLVIPYLHNGIFNIKAYGKQAIDVLDFWFLLFRKEEVSHCLHYKESLQKENIQISKKTQLYTSNNWIAYNKCTEKNGFYYIAKKDKNQEFVANFHSTLIGHLRTFFNNLKIEATKETPLKTAIINLELSKFEKVLFEKGNYISKHQFHVTLETNWELPSTFSLGQNIGYGNGVFTRIM